MSLPEVAFTAKKVSHKSKFTPEEDSRLSDLVQRYGDDDWFAIACLMPGRNQRQCRERWYHYLTPTVSSAPFTAEEDERLIQQFLELGPKWKTIAAHFPGRTDINLKNRRMLLARRNRLAESQDGTRSHPRAPICVPMPILPASPRPVDPDCPDELPWSLDDEDAFYQNSEANLTGDHLLSIL
jgi:hypothetical protein